MVENLNWKYLIQKNPIVKFSAIWNALSSHLRTNKLYEINNIVLHPCIDYNFVVQYLQ